MTPPRPRRRLSSPERREQLLDVTLELAAGGDLAAVSVRDIAARAGVSEGLLFHYFPTRQALVAAAVTRAADALLARLSEDAGATARERLEAALDGYLAHVVAQPTGWRALLAARTGELADLAADVERRSLEWTLSTLGIAEPSPVLLIALTGWAAYERDACRVWLDHPEVPVERVKAQLLATFTAALATAAETDPQATAALERLLV